MLYTFLQVVRDHPKWWFLLTHDGFGSHVNVTETLEGFCGANILLVK